MKTKALIMFDYDGVIVDSLKLFTIDFITACQENGFFEVKTQGDVMALFESNVYESMSDRGLDIKTIDAILYSYGIKQKEHLYDSTLFKGMGEALNKLSKSNKIFIITSNISSAPLKVLHRNGISCIEDVIGADKEKSKIKKIKMTMAQYPGLPAYYVGDTKGDMFEGKKAGAKTIGVTWGWHGEHKLKQSTPDHLIHSPQELTELLSEGPANRSRTTEIGGQMPDIFSRKASCG